VDVDRDLLRIVLPPILALGLVAAVTRPMRADPPSPAPPGVSGPVSATEVPAADPGTTAPASRPRS
jgi:hypothetical protein